MNYILQFTRILVISFLGELLHRIIPYPIPASIYGMILLFAALTTGLIKLEQVQETGKFLVSIMAVLFVCPAVGLLSCWEVVSAQLAQIGCIIVVSLLVTFAVAGWITQLLIRHREGHHG